MNPAESIAPLTIAERLAALRALTLTIREHLLAREWAQAAELDLTRRAGIAELFDDRPSAGDLPVLVTGRVSVESAMVKLRIGAMTLPAVLVSTNVPPFM